MNSNFQASNLQPRLELYPNQGDGSGQSLFIENYRSTDNGGQIKQKTTVPKAPSFRYKDPAVSNNVGYWRLFANEDIMSRYDDLMGVLDKTDSIDTIEGKREYIKQLKNTADFKKNENVKTWVNDLESGFYGMGAKELSYPTALMRDQMKKARQEYNINKTSRSAR